MSEEACTVIPSLGTVGESIVTNLWDVTPNALSVGRLVVNDGCSFSWHAGQRPCLTLPDGTMIWLKVSKFVAFLTHVIDDTNGVYAQMIMRQ